MRKTKVKRPEKETATTARDEGQDSSLSGAPSETSGDRGGVKRVTARRDRVSNSRIAQKIKNKNREVIC